MAISVPNQITLARLLLTGVFFALLSLYSVSRPGDAWMLSAAFWVFLVAAISDVVDGWLARTLKQVTSFGRIVDPVVDKVMVCGAFVFFAGWQFHDAARGVNVTGVAPWMVVIILLREFAVSAIRSFSEAQGDDFAANWVGKLKMFVQSATVCVVLGVLAWHPVSLAWLRETCVWLTVIVTTASLLAYLGRARAILLSREAMTASPPSIPTPAPPPSAPARKPLDAPPTTPPAPLGRAAGGPAA